MYAAPSPEYWVLKDIANKEAITVAENRSLAADAIEQHGLSERNARPPLGISLSVYLYRPRKKLTDVLIADWLQVLAGRKPRWGLSKIFHWLRHQGHRWNHKQVCSVKSA